MLQQIGEKVTDHRFITQKGDERSLSDIYRQNERTVLLFLRYYGCTACQLDLMEYKKEYDRFKALGAEVVIVLQSKPETVMESGPDLPYIIACDPEMKMYEKYNVKAAGSMLGLVSLKTFGKLSRAKKLGLQHGQYEGNELQLPAVFLLDGEGTIVYQRYARNLTDIPSIETLLEMIKA